MTRTSPAPNAPSAPYSAVVVGALTLAYTLSFVDRQILSLLVEPIKHDLHLSDTQISLLQGLAFTVLMGVGGLPIGWLVDRLPRLRIVSCGIAFWSVMTACCGLSGSYAALLLARMGVGLGESALNPAAYSALADAVPRKRLGFAIGVYGMGVYIGAGLAMILGAEAISRMPAGGLTLPLLGTMRSWQAVFVLVGLPGIFLALLTLLIREPVRRETLDVGTTDLPAVPSSTRRYLLDNRHALSMLILCQSFAAMLSFTLNAWAPSFFIRSFGWSIAQTGHAYGITIACAGVLGFLCCGVLGDRLAARGDIAARMRIMSYAMLASAPLCLLALTAADAGVALTLLGATTFLITVAIGSGPAALQEILPNRMRGTTTSLAVLVVNLIGLGLGPTLVAVLTDYVFADPKQLHTALAITTPCMALAATVFGRLSLKPYASSRLYLARYLREQAHAGSSELVPAAAQAAH
ncbi:MAG: MFS transporter [Rudaea sp.]|uniref:spinster family MFS transporter n=1 Tax=unclassified Rudaea TaxID=2627037 RepID=UPI0010F66575|nr:MULTISPECIES: MFS transporter [unclassified Rudaea]MBN8886253.1 MFS transporter [Rudaea sp.]